MQFLQLHEKIAKNSSFLEQFTLKMNIILFDTPDIRTSLLPFTYTRPIGKIRVGILTLEEKWHHYLGAQTSFLTENYLSKKYSTNISNDNILINGAICVDAPLQPSKLRRPSPHP